jgi:Acyl-CoA dehydrogenase, C-terminal domain
MDFRLTEHQTSLRNTIRDKLTALILDDEEFESSDIVKPVCVSNEVNQLYISLANTTWSNTSSGENDDLLDLVIACEESGRLPLNRTMHSLMLVSWIYRKLPGGQVIENNIDSTAIRLVNDQMHVDYNMVATLKEKSWTLSGTLDLVEGLNYASHILVTAKLPCGENGLFWSPLDALTVSKKPVRYIDSAQRAGSVSFSSTVAMRIGEKCNDVLGKIKVLGQMLTTAELLGAADSLLEHTCNYVRNRRQFEQPIGNFQSVAHGCAEMYRDVELMRSLLYAACVSRHIDGIPDDIAAAQARALATELAGDVADKSLQLFGAEGLRWKRGIHYLVRRIKALQVIFGDKKHCEETILSRWNADHSLVAQI